MEFEGKTFDSIDYFGERCCVCDQETVNSSKYNVFTSRYFSKREKTGFKEWRTTSKAWDFKHHSCRACDRCERKMFVITGIIFSVVAIGTAYFYFLEWEALTEWQTWKQFLPALIGFFVGAVIREQIDNRFGIEAVARKKAATIRGSGFVGFSSYDFSDIAKSIDT